MDLQEKVKRVQEFRLIDDVFFEVFAEDILELYIIYISEFDKYISFVFEVTADGETTYSKVISVTMNELIDMRLSMDDCKNAEADLLRFLKQYFAYIKAYIGN